MYDALPKNERTFSIDVVGETTGIQYKGEFVAKCVLNMAGKHAMELEKTRLMADYANPSPGLMGIAISLATVRAKVLKGPEWWTSSNNGADIIDENVIFAIFDECIKIETDWKAVLKKRAEEAQKGNAQAES